MKELYSLFGVVSVVTTPFDERDRIDLESLARTVDDRLAAGVEGIVLPAVASEVGKLSPVERRTLVRAVVERAAGRVPVIAGASAPDLPESIAMAEFAAELGCTGVLVQAPPTILHDRAALQRHFGAIAQTGAPMLMIQDLEWDGPGMPVDVVTQLFEEIPAFRCLKVEVVPTGPKYTAVLRATGGKLNVSGGWASMQLIEALDRGVHAFMPSAHHWVYVEILRRYQAGRRSEAQALFDRLLPILAFGTQHIDVSIQFQKLLAVRQGIFRTANVRSPSVVFDEYHRHIADELLERAMALHYDVGWRPLAGIGSPSCDQ